MQKLLISIDTEGPTGNNPIDALIYGKTENGEEYGIRYLMNLFNSINAKGLFFVDFAEAWDYGEERISEVVRCISAQGHDIGVHIHPDHMSDKGRRYLWEYSYDEQYEMILKCSELYEKLLHKQPLSFRAGRYGANNDTIKILDKLGYKYDMSEFYGNKYCRIEPPLCRNRVTKIMNTQITEVPVTTFKSFSSPIYSRFDKIDCGMDTKEFDRVMKQICVTGLVDVVSFFVHSFSVLNWRSDPNNPRLNQRLRKRLEEQLSWVNNCKDTMFIGESDLSKLECIEESTEDVLDVTNDIMSYWFFLKRAMGVLRDRSIRNV